MNIMKMKPSLKGAGHAQAKTSVVRNVGEKTSATTPMRSIKEQRGIYSATRNLDSNFRC